MMMIYEKTPGVTSDEADDDSVICCLNDVMDWSPPYLEYNLSNTVMKLTLGGKLYTLHDFVMMNLVNRSVSLNRNNNTYSE